MDDYNDPVHLERLSTLNFFQVEDLGAIMPSGQRSRNYTLEDYRVNEWYFSWLPHSNHKQQDKLTTYSVSLICILYGVLRPFSENGYVSSAHFLSGNCEFQGMMPLGRASSPFSSYYPLRNYNCITPIIKTGHTDSRINGSYKTISQLIFIEFNP